METYHVKVNMDLNIMLPENIENPELEIERLIDAMVEAHVQFEVFKGHLIS